MDYSKLAREIIEKNQYLVLSSPWISILCYAYDEEFNFYFISMPNSKHCTNISLNNNVSFAIYDSHQNFGEGVGLQIEGKVSLVPLSETPQTIKLYLSRSWPYKNSQMEIYLKGFQKVLKDQSYRAYKISPTKIWMNDPKQLIDVRVEVKL